MLPSPLDLHAAPEHIPFPRAKGRPQVFHGISHGQNHGTLRPNWAILGINCPSFGGNVDPDIFQRCSNHVRSFVQMKILSRMGC